MPQLGFVMRLEGQPLSTSLAASMPDYKLAFEGVVEGREAWFYRCQATQQLDEEYGDMLHTMRDVEVFVGWWWCLLSVIIMCQCCVWHHAVSPLHTTQRSVLGQLITALQDWLPALTAATHAMAQLDCLLSFAHAAQQHQLTCPTVTTDNVLHVIGGVCGWGWQNEEGLRTLVCTVHCHHYWSATTPSSSMCTKHTYTQLHTQQGICSQRHWWSNTYPTMLYVRHMLVESNSSQDPIAVARAVTYAQYVCG